MAPSAAVIGDVSLGNKASVWYGCVLKGEYLYLQNAQLIDSSVIASVWYR